MSIELINPFTRSPLQAFPDKLIDSEGITFPFQNGAYRLVQDQNYTDNFGFQWNRFEKTQIDRFQKDSTQSYDRFFSATGWNTQDLTGKNILEVGSGAGRFSQIILQHTAANLFSVDYSNAVEANYRNNGPHPRLTLFQTSIYELPFKPGQFDKVFCFGVLQHTPDFKRSIKALVSMVRPGGELVVDFYPISGWYTKIHSKYLLRPFISQMSSARLLSMIESNVDWLISTYNFFERMGIGKFVNRFLPVCDIKSTIPHGLDSIALREWVILDTFDMFSPTYDHPQRSTTVASWFTEFAMRDVNAAIIKYGDGNTVTVVKGKKAN
jgi:2-polyprenyl-3-methyl-5-hydroxy-6-metoxy-1,4-benzoquinol methylase